MPKRRKNILILILFSLIGHIVILFIICVMPFADRRVQIQQALKKIIPQRTQEEWAAIAPKPSAPVIFQNPIEPEETKEESTESKPEKQKEKEENIQKQEPKQIKKETAIIEKKRDTKTEQKEKKEKSAADQQALPPNVSPYKSSQAQKRISLADITKKFMARAKDEGTVYMDGNTDKLPTDEQLKLKRYLDKLGIQFHTSFRIHRDKTPASKAPRNYLTVRLTLARDGTLENLTLMQSSGNQAWDSFVLFALKDASSSFPPMPHYIKYDPFICSCKIML